MSTNSDLPNNLDWALHVLSVDRLSYYLAVENGDLSKAVAKYKENLDWSSDLYQWLAFAEITLRNALVASLLPKDNNGEDFNPFLGIWQDLRPEERADYDKAAERVISKSHVTTPGRIIAELNFGFWKYLLAADYEHSLWIRHFRHAFVALERKDRHIVYSAVDKVNQLRNKVAHHERLIGVDLELEIRSLAELIGWISPEALIWARNHLPDIEKPGQRD